MFERRKISGHRTVTIMALMSGLAACGETQPSRFYVLSPIQTQQVAEANVPARGSANVPARSSGPATVIGIGPIELPKYLDRGAIVTFTSANQLELAEFDRWAEPLSDNLARVMAENILGMISAARVEVYPFTVSGRSAPDYQIVVEVLRFRVGTEGSVELLANWNILAQDGRRSLASGSSRVVETAPPGNIEAMVGAMSRAVAGLSQDVAAAVQSAPKKR